MFSALASSFQKKSKNNMKGLITTAPVEKKVGKQSSMMTLSPMTMFLYIVSLSTMICEQNIMAVGSKLDAAPPIYIKCTTKGRDPVLLSSRADNEISFLKSLYREFENVPLDEDITFWFYEDDVHQEIQLQDHETIGELGITSYSEITVSFSPAKRHDDTVEIEYRTQESSVPCLVCYGAYIIFWVVAIIHSDWITSQRDCMRIAAALAGGSGCSMYFSSLCPCRKEGSLKYLNCHVEEHGLCMISFCIIFGWESLFAPSKF